MNTYQRVKKKMDEERAAQQAEQKPEIKEASELEQVLQGLTREEAEQMISEFMSADGLKNFIAARRATMEQRQVDQSVLMDEYRKELDKTTQPWQVMNLKRQYRTKGLNIT